MMKITVLAICLMLAMGVAASAATATIDVYPGWNMWSCPIVPTNPSPFSIMSSFDLMFTTIVMRFDAANQSAVTLDGFADPAAGDPVFGNFLLGEGYYTYNDVASSFTINGLADGVPGSDGLQTDMWISLPGAGQGNGGWHLIGCPFNHDVLIDTGVLVGDRIKFTDGVDVKNWDEAALANWVSPVAISMDNTTGNAVDTGYFFASDDHFRAGRAYFLQTLKDNLALIIPGNTTD